MAMKSRGVRVVALLCLLLAAAQSGAQSVTVEYLDGGASQRVTGAWTALAIGATLAPGASVKLEDHSLLQLKTAGATITLAQPGTYAIKDLVTARASLGAAGAGAAVADAFSKILHGTGESVSSPGGVRAEIAEPTDEQKWEAAHSQGPMDAGRKLLAEGQYAAAADQFFQATTVSEGSEADDAQFYLATAYALDGDARNALVSLAAISPKGDEEWIQDYVLLKAKLLEDTFAYSLALNVLLKQGATLSSDPERAPTWLFLLALGYKGTGDLVREKACLRKVVSLAPESELAEAAARLLNSP